MNYNDSGENRKLIERLERSLKDGRVSHAYLFEGSSDVDLMSFAKAFIKGILCPDRNGNSCGKCSICDKIDHDNHEDVFLVKRDGAHIKDASVIEMQDKLKVRPLGERNIAVISDSDKMTARAQNRILKTLEEPQGNSVIILLAENMQNLLGTVLSRCVKFRINSAEELSAADEESIAIRHEAEKIVSMCLNGDPYYKIRTVMSGKSFADDVEKLLDHMEAVYRNLLTDKSQNPPLYKFEDIYKSIHWIEESRKRISQGASSVSSFKNLILKTGG